MISFGEVEFDNVNVHCLFKHVHSEWPFIHPSMHPSISGRHPEYLATCLNKQGTFALLNSNSPKEIMQDNHAIVFGSAFSKEISSIPYFRANTITYPGIPDDDGKSMDGWMDG